MPGLPRYLEASVSILMLAIVSPAILLAGILIRLTSPGPVFFRQTRVGQNGESFTLWKLRTMRISPSGLQVTAANDSRVTWVGRLLRRTKVDELPELWNVFKGDLSLVGPRPEVPRYVDMKNPLWRKVLEARPGVTDPVTLRLRNEETLLAQVGGNREEYYLKVLQPFKLHGYLDYLDRRSGWTDAQVLWKTFVAVLLPRSAPLPSNTEIEKSRKGSALEDVASGGECHTPIFTECDNTLDTKDLPEIHSPLSSADFHCFKPTVREEKSHRSDATRG